MQHTGYVFTAVYLCSLGFLRAAYLSLRSWSLVVFAWSPECSSYYSLLFCGVNSLMKSCRSHFPPEIQSGEASFTFE